MARGPYRTVAPQVLAAQLPDDPGAVVWVMLMLLDKELHADFRRAVGLGVELITKERGPRRMSRSNVASMTQSRVISASMALSLAAPTCAN